MAENNRVVVYLAGQRVYGTEPGSGARTATELTESIMTVTVLGNPVQGAELAVEVQGVDGQPLHVQLTDLQGRMVSHRLVESAQAIEHQQFDVGNQADGQLLLQVSTPSQRQTVKILLQK